MEARVLQAANEHYLRLIGLFFSDAVHDAGKWWLDQEIAEMERDMQLAGLI